MRKWILIGCLLALLAVSSAAFAQETPPLPGEVVVADLLFPRGIEFDSDDNMIVVEAGNGGDTVIFELDDLQVTGGLSAAVRTYAPDGSETSASYYPSEVTPEAAGGVYRAYPRGDSLWLVFMNDSFSQPFTTFSDMIVEIDRATLRPLNVIDLWMYEVENNSDGTQEILSNPSDLAWDENGTMYIVDTGANALLTWTAEEGLGLFRAWGDNPVPTAIEFDADGNIWVGFLGTGIAPGAAKVEQWSPEGELLATFEGLTAVTDIEFAPDGSLYAVQLFTIDPANPEAPGPGSVVAVADGYPPVAEGLPFPHSIAFDSSGAMYVTLGTFAIPGMSFPGMVLRVG